MSWRPRLYRLRFFVSDAWDEFRHSPGANLLAVTTLAAALFLAGLILLVLANIEHRVQRLRGEVRLQVYLMQSIEPQRRVELERLLRETPGVERVEYVDAAEALRRYRAWAGELAALVDELETNPLPASFEVFLAPGPGAEAVGDGIVTTLGRLPGVEQVRFDRDWLERLESLLTLARLGGGGLAVLVFGAVVFVMASVLRLAVYARRDEIDIMLLVGATPGFVRGPFLVAGLVQGLLSSVVALVVVELVRRAVLFRSEAGSLALVELIAARPIPAHLAALLVFVGLAVSFAGSFFAVRRAL